MQISKLILRNFRQFYGEQTIEFARGDRKVTVIKGENGRGKTGIYRAVMFALYGITRLEQDSDDADIVLTNLKALEKDTERNGVTCSVTIVFEENGQSYELTRSFFSLIDNQGKITERFSNVVLVDTSQNEQIQEQEQINAFINNILDERVRNYFFFDGERIEKLTRVSQRQREEVSNGIKNLLKIDDLLKTKQVLETLNRQLLSKLSKSSTGDYKKKLNEKLKNDEEIAELNNKQQALKSRLAEAEEELAQIDRQLEQFQAESAVIADRNRLEHEVNRLKDNKSHQLDRLRSQNNVLHLLPAKNALLFTKSQIDAILGDEQEATVDSSYVQELLENLTCICGTSFSRESDEFQRLQALQKSLEFQEEKRELYDIQGNIRQLLGFLEGKEKDQQYLLDEIHQLETAIESKESELETLNSELRQADIPDIADLNKQRAEWQAVKIKTEHDIQEAGSRIKELMQENDQIELKLQDLKVKSGIHQKLADKQVLVQRSLNVMKEVIKKFEKEVITRLEEASTKNLAELLDEGGRMNIKSVQVQEDYSLEVLNSYGQTFLANISQGQRQVLSLSFITALVQTAGGSRNLELPLFMDTPFGRLSGKHQTNLLQFIPTVCSQWILLVTDREFGEEEEQLFRESNIQPEFYELKSIEPGETQLIKQAAVPTI